MTGWYFKELGAGYVRRTSHEEEFFNNSTRVDAVVREAIQNSIDARDHSRETVMVRFCVGRTKDKVGDLLLAGLPEHLSAAGIKVSSQIGIDGIPYLAIEDFNTTGLTGDLEQNSQRAQQGDFYNFWWADGSMKKGGQSGGRWGLGKYTFFVSSKLKTFWGLTAREGAEKKILMGRSLLKPHSVGNILYNLDGFFVSSQEFKPIVSDNAITEFEQIFQLKREQFRGLSIVIPFPLDEMDADSILFAVLDHYLYSIVADKVRINIFEQGFRNPDREHILNKNTIIDLLRRKASENSRRFSEHYSLARMFEQVLSSEISCVLSIDDPLHPEITEKSFGDKLEDLRQTLESASARIMIKLRIPIMVRESKGVANNSYYDIIIAKEKDLGTNKSKVFCLRSGILVTDAVSVNAGGLVVMLIAEDDKIAQFLGDAENPSHTKWSSRTENFSDNYTDGRNLLVFIMESPNRILDILKKAPEKRDPNLLVDVFYIDVERSAAKPPVHGGEVPPIKRNPRLVEISQMNDGFSVSLGSDNVKSVGTVSGSFPFECKIETAYMVRRGSPLKKYNKQDFDLSKPPITLQIEGKGDVLHVDGNRVVVRVNNSDFALHARGFDKNRDIYVSVIVIKTGGEADADKEV